MLAKKLRPNPVRMTVRPKSLREYNCALRLADRPLQLPMIETIARIRIELQDLEPKIWRRVDVPVSSTLMALHDVIQIAFSWTDTHLFEFVVGERSYAEAMPEYADLDQKIYNAKYLRLKTIIGRSVRRFVYIYDFGDNWRHDVIIEEVRDGDADIDYPAFVDGARRRPPEDVGSFEGYMNFLEAALDPTHTKHGEMLSWYGRPFDLDDIDERRVRILLEVLARRRRGPLMSHRSKARGNRSARRDSRSSGT